MASSSLDSKVRIYNIESDKEIREYKTIDMEAMQLWKIDYHPKNEEILYGTLSLNTTCKFIFTDISRY